MGSRSVTGDVPNNLCGLPFFFFDSAYPFPGWFSYRAAQGDVRSTALNGWVEWSWLDQT